MLAYAPAAGGRAFNQTDFPHRNTRLLALVGFVGLCLLVLAANGSITAPAVAGWYRELRQPPGTPPDWLFAPVWTLLYVGMGVAAWLVWCRVEAAAHRKRAALRLWGWQLGVNALWPACFFGLRAPALAAAVIAVLLVLVVLTLRAFWPLRRAAGVLLLPYLGWLAFAAYLNAGVVLLNRG